MRRTLACLVLSLAALAPAAAAAADEGLRFVAIAFHDVVDRAEDLDGDAVTTDRLVGFFEWVRASGLKPVTLDDIDAARRGVRPLPQGAILVTFDDAYRSLYSRVFPLLLAYRIPIVAAVVGEWVDAPPGAQVNYGGRAVPRSRFISWDEAREMQASGLVEFASHSYALHRGIVANPQGSERPAATARRHDPAAGYETEAAYRERIAADLARSVSLMRRELGRAPRALVWPFGRYRGANIEIARAAGFAYAFTLDPEPASAAAPFAIARYWPSGNPGIGDIASGLRFDAALPAARTFVCVDPARLAGPDLEVRLGAAIERLVRLGATAVALDAFERDGEGYASGAWFPNAVLPVRADVLSRIAWQMHRRAGVEVYVRFSRFRGMDPAAAMALADDLAAHVPLGGLLIEDAPALAARAGEAGGAPWQVRARREAIAADTLPPDERPKLAAMRLIERAHPGTRVAVVADGARAPSSVADLTFLAARDAAALDGLGADLAPAQRRRLGAWMTASEPPSAVEVTAVARAARRRGIAAVGWCPDDPVADVPASAELAPAVSAATFPHRR